MESETKLACNFLLPKPIIKFIFFFFKKKQIVSQIARANLSKWTKFDVIDDVDDSPQSDNSTDSAQEFSRNSSKKFLIERSFRCQQLKLSPMRSQIESWSHHRFRVLRRGERRHGHGERVLSLSRVTSEEENRIMDFLPWGPSKSPPSLGDFSPKLIGQLFRRGPLRNRCPN